MRIVLVLLVTLLVPAALGSPPPYASAAATSSCATPLPPCPATAMADAGTGRAALAVTMLPSATRHYAWALVTFETPFDIPAGATEVSVHALVKVERATYGTTPAATSDHLGFASAYVTAVEEGCDPSWEPCLEGYGTQNLFATRTATSHPGGVVSVSGHGWSMHGASAGGVGTARVILALHVWAAPGTLATADLVATVTDLTVTAK